MPSTAYSSRLPRSIRAVTAVVVAVLLPFYFVSEVASAPNGDAITLTNSQSPFIAAFESRWVGILSFSFSALAWVNIVVRIFTDKLVKYDYTGVIALLACGASLWFTEAVVGWGEPDATVGDAVYIALVSPLVLSVGNTASLLF